MRDDASAATAQNEPARSGNDAARPAKSAISERRSRFESRNAPAFPSVWVVRAISPSMRSHHDPNTSRTAAHPHSPIAARTPAASAIAAPIPVMAFAESRSAIAAEYCFIRSGGVGRTSAYRIPVPAALASTRNTAIREDPLMPPGLYYRPRPLADGALGRQGRPVGVLAKLRLEHRLLLEEVVDRRLAWGGHRALEEEREPLLRPLLPCPLREVAEQREVEHDRRSEDRVAALEVHLDLHRVAEPPEDVDGVPAFLVVAARRVVVDRDLVVDVALELRVLLRREDLVEHRLLRDLLRLERVGVVEDLAVAVAEDVRREPALEPEEPRVQHRRDGRLDERLAGLEVLAAGHDAGTVRELAERRDVLREVRRAVQERNAGLERRPRVHHRGRDRGIAGVERRLERLQREMGRAHLRVDLRRAGPDHDRAGAAVRLHERADVLHEALGLLPERPLLHVRTVEPAHPGLVEHGRHRPDRLELLADGIEVLAAQHVRADRGAVGVVGDGIPAAEDEVVEPREREHVAERRPVSERAVLQVTELRERADRRGELSPDRGDAGDGGRRDRPHTREQDGELLTLTGGLQHGTDPHVHLSAVTRGASNSAAIRRSPGRPASARGFYRMAHLAGRGGMKYPDGASGGADRRRSNSSSPSTLRGEAGRQRALDARARRARRVRLRRRRRHVYPPRVLATLAAALALAAPAAGPATQIARALVTAPAGGARAAAATRAFVGAPYAPSPLGEGAGRDPDPRFRLDAFDCMTLVETAVALGSASSLAEARVALDDVRYAGAPTYVRRNHEVLSQWIPANVAKGFVAEATAALPRGARRAVKEYTPASRSAASRSGSSRPTRRPLSPRASPRAPSFSSCALTLPSGRPG